VAVVVAVAVADRYHRPHPRPRPRPLVDDGALEVVPLPCPHHRCDQCHRQRRCIGYQRTCSRDACNIQHIPLSLSQSPNNIINQCSIEHTLSTRERERERERERDIQPDRQQPGGEGYLGVLVHRDLIQRSCVQLLPSRHSRSMMHGSTTTNHHFHHCHQYHPQTNASTTSWWWWWWWIDLGSRAPNIICMRFEPSRATYVLPMASTKPQPTTAPQHQMQQPTAPPNVP
jgi:hypothetical protein